MSEHLLAVQTRAAQVLKSALAEYADDHDLIADMIEAETSLHEAIAAVMAGIDEDEMMIVGLEVMANKLGARCKRYQDRIDRRRTAIERGMMAGELTKLELPQATLSIRSVPPKLDVVNETEIPAKYFENVPKLKRTELWADVKAGQDIPGVRMTNGSTTLAIRRA